MAVNFCNPAFGTEVTASSVSADGYEPENLLKPGAFGQWKGFLADYFIKPPLNVTFAFPCNINIHSIVIDPKVGSQRSSGLEIFSASVPQQKDAGTPQDGENQSKHSSHSATSNQGLSRSSASTVSTNIGKAFCHDIAPRLICFNNWRYRPLHKDLKPKEMYQDGLENVVARNFRCPYQSCVDSVNQVVIRIIKAQGGSVPALKKVEIWGQPSPSCDKITIARVLDIANRIQGRSTRKPSCPVKKKDEASVSSNTKGVKNTRVHLERTESKTNVLQCPEEFEDPISCEMMVRPVLLPSGHTIDQETLERHNRVEASWGRAPNDPFTSVPFTPTNKPVPNVKLKVRIDKFLLMGGGSLQNVPRTSGTAGEPGCETNATSGIQASVLVHPRTEPDQANSSGCVAQVGDNLNRNSNVDGDKSQVKQLQRKRKRKVQPSLRNQDTCPTTVPKKTKLHMSVDTTKMDAPNSIKDPRNHEKLVSDSLDDALMQTMASLPSFSKNTSPCIAADQEPRECSRCKATAKGNEVVLYRMPCSHLICRKCTSSDPRDISCRLCSKTYNSSEMLRVHTR